VTQIQPLNQEENFAEISQYMFSKIRSAFTEVAEMKTKNGEKSALLSIKCSRGALPIVGKTENWKNTKKKNYFRR